MADDFASRSGKKRRDPRKKPQITRWKRVLLVGAVLFVAIGIGLRAAASADDAGDAPSPPPPGNALVDTASPLAATPSKGQPEAEGASSWSPFFLKSGFSFLVAFCVGFAARVWLKITLLVAGTVLLVLFGLSYSGVLEVDWNTLGGAWDAVAGRVAEEARDFKGFVTGSLPQAGLATVGLVAGFKMR